MGGFSFTHILVVIFLYLLFSKPSRLSDATRSIGKTIRNFKQSLNEIEVDPNDIKDDPTLIDKKK